MLESTQAVLVVTAERLFALHGIDQISLRQIASAAGQRNTAAVQYHFGTKLDLLRTIVRFRIAPYSDRELALCQELDRQGRGHDLRGLVEASLLPFAQLDVPESHFVEFLAELMKAPDRFMEVFAGVEDELLEGVRMLDRRLLDALDHLPLELREVRLNVAVKMGLSAIARSSEPYRPDGVAQVPRALLVDDLVEAITAFLGAPAPARAATLLGAHR